MDILIAVLVATAVYYLSYRVLFEDRNEWLVYAKHELKWLPISVILDYDPHSSSKFWFWLMSGFLLGGGTYFVLSHY